MTRLYVVDLTYIVELSQTEEHLAAHQAFLDRHYESGLFLVSGRKEPRTGGVIVATGTREEVERAVAEDPFSIAGVARYEITEFVPSRTAPALARYRDTT